MKTVLLRHPQTKGEWACPVAAVNDWLEKGWTRASAPVETTDTEPMADLVVPQTTNTRKDK
jgi:hypothetical protein